MQRYLVEAADGRTPTAVGVDHAIGQLEGYLALPVSEDALLKPVREAEPAVREAAAAQVAETIRPAMQRLAELLRRELAPVARPDDRVGIGEIPGGEAGYLAAVARHTTTTLSPDDIHAIGLAELDELAGLWSRIGQEALGESDFATIAARMRDDPALRFRSREEILALVQDALDRAEAVRDTYFEHYDIPACAIEEINPIDAGNTAMAYYRPPAVDGSRPGAHCLLTTNPAERYRYEYEALAFHESVPGHHLQLATAQTLDIPRYRRHLDAELCAFNEGWGLYAERLADEIGLYSSGIARLGMLSVRLAPGLPARRGHRPAPPGLVASAGDRLHVRPHRDHARPRAQRGRPLHRLARPGARLRDRQARDRAPARAGAARTRAAIRPAPVPPRGAAQRRYPPHPAR